MILLKIIARSNIHDTSGKVIFVTHLSNVDMAIALTKKISENIWGFDPRYSELNLKKYFSNGDNYFIINRYYSVILYETTD